MATSRSAPRTPAVLLAVVAIALAIGGAASLIAGAASAPSFQPGPISDLFLSTGAQEIIVLAALVTFAALGIWVYYDNRMAIPGRATFTALVMIVLMLLFIAIFETGGAPNLTNTVTTRTNGTANNSTPVGTGNATQHGNVSVPGGVLGGLNLGLPSWALFALVAGGALVVAAFVLPALVRKMDLSGGRRGVRPAEVEHADRALRSAQHALDEGAEPREVIIRLYATLLERVGPIVGGVEGDTPEEIRITHLVHLGIRQDAAATLTRLFEEARYSSHPLGREAAAAAQDAIVRARADLDRPRALAA